MAIPRTRLRAWRELFYRSREDVAKALHLSLAQLDDLEVESRGLDLLDGTLIERMFGVDDRRALIAKRVWRARDLAPIERAFLSYQETKC